MPVLEAIFIALGIMCALVFTVRAIVSKGDGQELDTTK